MITSFIVFLIVLFACTLGAISGLGGGIIIKPLMDALGEWQICRRIGEVTDGPALELQSGSSTLAAVPVEELATAFKVTLDW